MSDSFNDSSRGVRKHHVRLVIIDIRSFFEKQSGQFCITFGHSGSECFTAKLSDTDSCFFQHGNILGPITPAHFLKSPLFLLTAEVGNLSSKE